MDQQHTATAMIHLPIAVVTTSDATTAFIDDLDVARFTDVETAGSPRGGNVRGLLDAVTNTAMTVGHSRTAYAGVAKHHPFDKLDVGRGRALALARLLRDVAADLERRAAPILADDAHTPRHAKTAKTSTMTVKVVPDLTVWNEAMAEWRTAFEVAAAKFRHPAGSRVHFVPNPDPSGMYGATSEPCTGEGCAHCETELERRVDQLITERIARGTIPDAIPADLYRQQIRTELRQARLLSR